MAVLFASSKFSATNALGIALSSGKVYTYLAGTLNPAPTYTNAGGLSANTNPIILDATGRANVWLDPTLTYRFIVRDSNDGLAPDGDIDNIVPNGAAAIALRGELVSASDTAKGDALIGYKRTLVGAVASTLHLWHEKAFVMPTDFGAVGDGVTDDTAAAQLFFTRCASSNVCGYIPDNFNMSVTGVSINLLGTRLNANLKVIGGGRATSKLTKRGASTAPVLEVLAAPAAYGLNLHFADFGIFGNSKVSPGLTFGGIAQFCLDRMLITGHTNGFEMKSSLIGSVNDTEITDNNNGVITTRTGIDSYVNIVQFKGGRINYNSTLALDLDRANMLTFEDVCLEQNGTAGNTATGACFIRSDYGTEVGFGQIAFVRCWGEGNLGRYIQNAAPATGFQDLVIRGGHCINQEGGRCLNVTGLRQVSIDGWQCPSAADTANISCDKLEVRNSYIAVITEAAVGASTYINVQTVAGEYLSGRVGSTSALTYTGGATSPTPTWGYRKQGRDVVLTTTTTLMTSSATSFTATGLDIFLRPTANRSAFVATQDNGVDSVTVAEISTTGVINFASLKNYSAVGSKGTRICEIRYSI